MDMKNHTELFKFNIMQYIFTNRIYKNYDLENFHKQLIQKNKKHLSVEEVEEIFTIIKNDLDN
jgi:hypothetical protein